MLKAVKIYVLLFFGLSTQAQPEINQWYTFGCIQSVFGSVVATDSCYYATGIGINQPGIWDAGFFKLDLNGTIVSQSFLHSDTVSIKNMGTVGSNLLQTFDTNFAALAVKMPYLMFIKYAPNGDTLFTSTLNNFYINDNLTAYQPGMILQLESDSSFTCTAYVQNNITLKSAIIIFNISQAGNLNFYETYYTDDADFPQFQPNDLIKTDVGYLISTTMAKVSGPVSERKHHVRLIHTNELGQEIGLTTYSTELLGLHSHGFTPTSDGGYIYGGMTGWFIPAYNGHRYMAHIVKLDPAFNRQWEIEVGDSVGINYIDVAEILPLDDETFITAGYTFEDSMTCGWIFKFNLDGQVIWDSYFSYVPDTSPNTPMHQLYDIQLTSDNGLVMVGFAWDKQATFEGDPGYFAWLVKTDSVGCLVPGCQDFLELPEQNSSTISLSVYPNPTNDVLNIHYYDFNFSGDSDLMIYDLSGNLVKTWKLHSNDMTYIYGVSGLSTGTYVVEVIRDGAIQQSQKFIKN